MKISEVIKELDRFAPPSLQESYDNAGLLVGDQTLEVTSILLTLDITEDVVQEAIDKKCNLIVAHHPIIFSGLKSLTGKNYVERTVLKAIKNDIALFSAHTNLDNVNQGVNKKFADKLELQNIKILSPKKGKLQKLTTYVPQVNTDDILEALFDVGAGNIGEYENCSFQHNGIGTFKPSSKANPHIGESGKLESVQENKIEVIVPEHLTSKVLKALFTSHPYEEVAYYLSTLENENQDIGSGMIGDLEQEMSSDDFLGHLKNQLNLEVIKFTPFNRSIKKVALCGGSGQFLLKNAINSGADAYVSADFKYHEYFDADNQIMICDIGHYESEISTKELFYEVLSDKFSNIALVFAETNTNPTRYYR